MNIQQPYKLSNIDLSNIVYPSVKQTDKKKIILIKYQDKDKIRNLVFQTPTVLNIDKAKLFFNGKNGYGEIDVALHGKNNSKVDKFISFLYELENKIKKDAYYNGNKWFHDIPNQKNILNFQKLIRESETFDNGTIKLKLLKNTNFETVIQYNNKQRTQIKDIPDNSWVKMILEVYAVWINPNNDFGVFLRPILVSYTKDNYNYDFVHDTEEEDNCDIPDTEINNNIFIKRSISSKVDYSNDVTSQLDIATELLNRKLSVTSTKEDDTDVKNNTVNSNESTNELNASSSTSITHDNDSDEIKEVEEVEEENKESQTKVNIKVNVDSDDNVNTELTSSTSDE